MKKFHNPVGPGADPFILLYEGKYYLYFTIEDGDTVGGYKVYESDDLSAWEYKGYCLTKDDVMGNQWFWAPEITYYKGKFYMAYTSEEHIGIAEADSPLGPFRQQEKRWLSERNAIDGHFFIDDDGQAYLYYVRFYDGNRIYVAKLSDDLQTLDEENEQFLIRAEEPWETVDCLVAEGPFVLKHNGLYYLTYSTNHTRCQDYAVGYAVSDSPLGPFKKYEGNPILHKNEIACGVGHHSFTTTKDGKQLLCVYHRHNSMANMGPRMTCIDTAEFVPAEDGGNDIFVINGPTSGMEL